jgi:5-methylcytosine-specific restriction endonuclease McrA
MKLQGKGEIFSADIDSASKAVLLFISFRSSIPCAGKLTVQEIANYTGLSRRTVSRRVDGLSQLGILSAEYAIDRNALATHSYRYKGDFAREYQEHKDFVFNRDGYRCVYCGSTLKLSLDHVIPQSKGGSHDPSNLVTACKSCNCSKKDQSLESWKGVKS